MRLFKFDFQKLFGKATDAFFAMGLTGTTTFHEAIRPVLHGHAGGDIQKAQALAIQGLHDHIHVVERHSASFLERYDDKTSYDSVKTTVAGKRVVPVGTASGLDPDAEALRPLSYLYGFQMPGPVLAHPRTLERIPFVEDSRRDDLYLPPIFASKGADHFLENLRRYRGEGGDAVLLPAVVGAPSASGDPTGAFREVESLLLRLEPFADGFVWCPYWSGSGSVISEDEFARTGDMMARLAGPKLKLVEMFACEEDGQESWLRLVDRFLAAGGDGIVAVTGLAVPTARVPRPDSWGFEGAVLCGHSLAAYRQRAIEAARRRFPKAFIAACGGFHSRDEAFTACEHADVIAENEAYTRYGPGMTRVLLQKLALRLQFLARRGEAHTESLVAYQRARWATLEPGADR